MISLLDKLSFIFNINYHILIVFYAWTTVFVQCKILHWCVTFQLKIPGFKFNEDPLTHATAVQITAAHLPKLKSRKVIPISAIPEKLVFMHLREKRQLLSHAFPIELNRIKLGSDCEINDTSMLSCTT